MTPDESIQAILNRQYGLITPQQAQTAGMSRGVFEHRVRTRRLLQVYASVYRSPSAPRSFEHLALAACLASRGWASHLTAAAAFKVVDQVDRPIEVSIPFGTRRAVRGVVVHRARLSRADRTMLGPIPITSIPRTLVDIAPILAPRDLAEAADRAVRRKLISPKRLDRAVRDSRFDRAKGIRTLREIAADRLRDGVPDSILEADALAVLKDFNLPTPKRQVEMRARGRCVAFDLAYPEERVAIELDGKAPHSELPTWQRDHSRHNAVELGSDVKTLHFTWWDVHETPVYFAATVADALGLRPVRWRSR